MASEVRARKGRRNFGCSFPPTITVGKNLYIAHANGIGIGKTTVIGDNCKIYPKVEIAAALKGDSKLRASGAKRWHAKIGNDVILGVGCTIIGPVEIGDDTVIAAGAMVTKDVPPHTVVKNVNEFRAKRPDEMSEAYTEADKGQDL